MRNILVFIVAILTVGCQSGGPQDQNLLIAPMSGSKSQKIDDYHLACREKSGAQSQHILNKILAQNELEGVILYFHGGLSGRNYMEDELGPMLMESIFKQESLSNYYPVFVNYDASPLTMENIERQIKALTEDAAFKRAENKFYRKIRKESELLKINKGLSAIDGATEAELGQFYIDSVITSVNKSAAFALKSNEEKQEVYFNILKNDALAEELEKEILSNHTDLADIQKDLQSVNRNPEKGVEKAFSFSPTTKVIIRAMARFASNTHHQIVPTFEEEAFKAYKLGGFSIQSYAANHWQTVKINAQQCFAEKSSGRLLVDALLDKGIPVHTISHSAGSIPTGQLLKHVFRTKGKITSVNLIVPAINQSDFSKLFIENQAAAKKIQGYVLRKKEESIDSIAFGLYPASLLYFVSGSADNAWYNDKMLMIDQHLRPERKVYSREIYQRITGERPERVWEYLEKERSNWFFYPDEELDYEVENFGKRASHECTKYPWISTEVVKKIIFNITGNNVENIPIPRKPESVVAKANRSCRWAGQP